MKGNVQKLQCLSDAAGAAGFPVLMPSQGTIYGHYGLFLALLMDSAQLLSIMEKDGRTTMPEVIGSRCSDITLKSSLLSQNYPKLQYCSGMVYPL